MNPAFISFIIKVSALSALVSAFMSFFLKMTIPGLTFLSLGVMFLSYAAFEFIAYNKTKKILCIFGIAAYTLAAITLFAVGVMQIIK